MTETWLPIPGTDGVYEASSLGHIRSKDRLIRQPGRWGGEIEYLRRGQILKPWFDANGYPTVYLANRKAVNVHRLVALAFHGERDGLHANHIDGDKANNRPENLEWVTRSENMRHARDTGLLRDEKPLIAIPKDGGAALVFRSLGEATDFVGKGRRNIQAAAKGKFPSAYGFRWAYADAA